MKRSKIMAYVVIILVLFSLIFAKCSTKSSSVSLKSSDLKPFVPAENTETTTTPDETPDEADASKPADQNATDQHESSLKSTLDSATKDDSSSVETKSKKQASSEK